MQAQVNEQQDVPHFPVLFSVLPEAVAKTLPANSATCHDSLTNQLVTEILASSAAGSYINGLSLCG